MRQLVTIAVVSGQLRHALQNTTPEQAEGLLIINRHIDEIAFFRCLLDSWDRSDHLMLEWIQQNRPAATERLRALTTKGILLIDTDGEAFLPKPYPMDITSWYRSRSLGEDDLQAFVAALYDGLATCLSTKCSLVITCRTLGPSIDDREYRDSK